ERTMGGEQGDIGWTVGLGLAGTDFALDNTKDVDVKVVGTVLGPTIGEGDLGEVSAVTLGAITAAGGNDTPQLIFGRYRSADTGAVTAAIRNECHNEMQTDIVPAQAVT